MKHLHVFVWTLALTCLAMFPATVRADDDDLEGFDVTMEVLDDDADLDGMMAEMRGPESNESNDGTDGDDESDEADDGGVDDDLANELDDDGDGDDGFDGENEFEEEDDLEEDGDFEDDEHVEDDVVEDGMSDEEPGDESGDGID